MAQTISWKPARTTRFLNKPQSAANETGKLAVGCDSSTLGLWMVRLEAEERGPATPLASCTSLSLKRSYTRIQQTPTPNSLVLYMLRLALACAFLVEVGTHIYFVDFNDGGGYLDMIEQRTPRCLGSPSTSFKSQGEAPHRPHGAAHGRTLSPPGWRRR